MLWCLALLQLGWAGEAQGYTDDVVVHWSGESVFDAPGGADFDLVVRRGVRWPGRLEYVSGTEVVAGDLTCEQMQELRRAIAEADLEPGRGGCLTWEPQESGTQLSLPQLGVGPVWASFEGGSGGAYDIPSVFMPLSPCDRDRALRRSHIVRVLRGLLSLARKTSGPVEPSILPSGMPAPAMLVVPASTTATSGRPLEVALRLANRGQRPFRIRPASRAGPEMPWLEVCVSAVRPPAPDCQQVATPEIRCGDEVRDGVTVEPGDVLDLMTTVVLPLPGHWRLAARARAGLPPGCAWLQDPPLIAGTMATANRPWVTVVAPEGDEAR